MNALSNSPTRRQQCTEVRDHIVHSDKQSFGACCQPENIIFVGVDSEWMERFVPQQSAIVVFTCPSEPIQRGNASLFRTFPINPNDAFVNREQHKNSRIGFLFGRNPICGGLASYFNMGLTASCFSYCMTNTGRNYRFKSPHCRPQRGISRTDRSDLHVSALVCRKVGQAIKLWRVSNQIILHSLEHTVLDYVAAYLSM